MSLPKLLKILAGAALAGALTGCTWVDLKPEGEKVRILASSEIKRCKPLGHVTSNTAATLGLFARSASTVREELNRLARNHAGGMGGDTVVPSGPIIDGEQSYDVYRCINP
ncbi:DUF4156 domain-containing protein [Methylomagnum sp.]